MVFVGIENKLFMIQKYAGVQSADVHGCIMRGLQCTGACMYDLMLCVVARNKRRVHC